MKYRFFHTFFCGLDRLRDSFSRYPCLDGAFRKVSDKGGSHPFNRSIALWYVSRTTESLLILDRTEPRRMPVASALLDVLMTAQSPDRSNTTPSDCLTAKVTV